MRALAAPQIISESQSLPRYFDKALSRAAGPESDQALASRALKTGPTWRVKGQARVPVLDEGGYDGGIERAGRPESVDKDKDERVVAGLRPVIVEVLIFNPETGHGAGLGYVFRILVCTGPRQGIRGIVGSRKSNRG